MCVRCGKAQSFLARRVEWREPDHGAANKFEGGSKVQVNREVWWDVLHEHRPGWSVTPDHSLTLVGSLAKPTEP